ncbi:MAG TPA: glutathione S-transferase family protein [Caulobacteraceae bacterium]|nr:glutathione S-transferase family protein [Caulobacteraceae bacterium]
MAEVVIHSRLLSPYGWTSQLVAAEKGIDYRVAEAVPASPEHRALHPFAKVPVLEHGEVVIFETLAICHYLDRRFPGPALQPVDCLGQARMLSWISAYNAYVFPPLNLLVKERYAASFRGEEPDAEAIANLTAALDLPMATIETALERHSFLVGEHFTLADAFLLPMLHIAAFGPEFSEALAARPAARAWLGRVRARPSFAATNPLPACPAPQAA